MKKNLIIITMIAIICAGCGLFRAGNTVRRVEIINDSTGIHYILEGDFVTVPIPATNVTTTIYKDCKGKLNVVTQ